MMGLGRLSLSSMRTYGGPLRSVGFTIYTRLMCQHTRRNSSSLLFRSPLVPGKVWTHSASLKSGESSPEPGLYVVGTPIGNLEDISKRALDTLKCVDKVLCEDTRRTKALLNHYGIRVRTESFHLHNEFKRTKALIDELKQGQAIALVSDAGMPGINDPGGQIISQAAQENVRIIPIPGPSAFLIALVGSGLLGESFTYCGFIASKSSERKKQLKKYNQMEHTTFVFYVSPHALVESLADAVSEFGPERKCCVARELTKIHEEFVRCTLQEAYVEFQERKPRGEFTLIIAGSDIEQKEIADSTIIHALSLEIEQGVSRSMAARNVSESLQIPRKRVYELSLKL